MRLLGLSPDPPITGKVGEHQVEVINRLLSPRPFLLLIVAAFVVVYVLSLQALTKRK